MASLTMNSITGVSRIGKSAFGTDFVKGRNRVPRPATGMTALVTFDEIIFAPSPQPLPYSLHKGLSLVEHRVVFSLSPLHIPGIFQMCCYRFGLTIHQSCLLIFFRDPGFEVKRPCQPPGLPDLLYQGPLRMFRQFHPMFVLPLEAGFYAFEVIYF